MRTATALSHSATRGPRSGWGGKGNANRFRPSVAPAAKPKFPPSMSEKWQIIQEIGV